MITINQYLDGVLAGFKTYLDEGHQLCELKDMNFDAGKIPKYDDVHHQQYYLLRYAFAYAYEYKRMYNRLLTSFVPNGKMTVTSVGCGTMLDYWALVRALEGKNIPARVEYIGIDLVDWNYKIPKRETDTVTFLHKDAVEALLDERVPSSDVFFFPKSISEFPDDVFSKLCGIFENIPFAKRKIYVLSSIRTDETSRKNDLARLDQLTAAICRNGFVVDGFSDGYYGILDEDRELKIHNVDPDFRCPFDAIETIKNLCQRCSSYDDESLDCQKDCEDRLGRMPILTLKQVQYKFLRYERVS